MGLEGGGKGGLGFGRLGSGSGLGEWGEGGGTNPRMPLRASMSRRMFWDGANMVG